VEEKSIPNSKFLELGRTFDKHTRETMKKILIATTALVATAGVAAADVAFSGYGRFGVLYNGGAAAGTSKTTIESRLRFNIDVSKETDSGVTFGGRVRMQYDDGDTTTESVPANLYASYNGLKVTVGNVGGAYDDSAVMYNSELGLVSSSYGDPQGNFYYYESSAYSAAQNNRMGVNVAYAIGGFSMEASYITPDDTTSASVEETALTAAYKYNQFTISAAVANNGAGIKDNDVYFLGAEFAVNDMANIGLLYFDNGTDAAATDLGNTVTLYGNYKMDALTLRGYVANTDDKAYDAAGFTKTAFGIGADYDLGGATLLGSVERGYDKEAFATMGVKFSF
jgi:outer membrane protein OmpU